MKITFGELEQKRQTQGLSPAENKDWERLFNQNDYAIEQVFRVPIDGKVAIANQANRQIVRQWAEGEIEPITSIEAWFANLFRENPSLAGQLSWQNQKMLDPAYRAELAKKSEQELRARFLEVCKNNGLENSDANFNLWAQSGPDPVVSWFNSRPVIVLETGDTLELTPATQQQIDQWASDARNKSFQEHQAKLKDMALKNDIAGLRREAQKEAEEQQLTSFEKNRNYRMLKGFIARQEKHLKPLPEYWQGQKLTSEVLRHNAMKTNIIRELVAVSGQERVNALIFNIQDIEDFFSDAESKLRALAAEEYHEISWTR